jgi:MoxR-like ATPase
MPRIILSIVVIVAIVGWVVFLQLRLHKEHKVQSTKHKEHEKSYVSAEVLLQWVEKLSIKHEKIADLKLAIHEQIVGMEWFINAIIITLLAGGHALVEWVPWLAKTKTIHTFADLLWLDFWRIQFTPDMLPSDVTGVDVFNPATRSFETSIGPIMTNILLADEINRTTPKVQAALLESMQERQVTIWWKTVKLPHPFFVLATQNPLEQEGTYPLPEAQIDRFLCKIMVDYPSLEQEKLMLEKLLKSPGLPRRKAPRNDVLISHKELLVMQEEVAAVDVPSSIKDYIARIVQETRAGYSTILYGSSPRWSISLMQAAQAVAYVQWHQKVSAHDVHMVVLLTLRHRIILTYEAKLQNKNEDTILSEIVQYLPLS